METTEVSIKYILSCREFPVVVVKSYKIHSLGSAIPEFFESFVLDFYVSVVALLQVLSPILMSDVYFCRMKINKIDAIRTFDLAFDVRFNIPSG